MTVHPTEQLYKTRMAEAQALEGAEAEYHSLEQGPYGTDLRHKAIVDFVQGWTVRSSIWGAATA